MKIYSSEVSGSLKVRGDIFAENYIVKSTVSTITQSFSSGSTIFGDSTDDTHQFTGSINVTGSLVVRPGDSDLTDNGALGLWVKGLNGGIKIGRHSGNDGAYSHLYTDVASTDFLYVKNNGGDDGGIATDRIGTSTQNPVNNYIHFDGFDKDFYGYYLINGSIKIPVMKQAMMKGGRFFTKQGDTWSWQTPDNINVGNYFLDKDANEVEITSKTEVAQEDTFYSLDVENIDTYFTSDILVHNIPPGKCFTGDTMITLADGTYENIQKIKPGTEIKTYNEETGKLQNSVVGEITKIRHDNLVKYKFSDNTEIKATDDHPFYVGGDYKAPLEVGDEVLNDELNKVNVVKVEKLAYMQITYNIDNTNNGKNYFANRVLVSDESDT